jgi:tetratricopeptide (TPR) repeat protein
MRYVSLFVGLMCSASAALAGEKPLHAPAPAWVKPAPAIDPAKIGADAPVLLRIDNQQKIEDGETWSYVETAMRAASAETLSAIGTVQLPWQPAHGDLIFHSAHIIRGKERIDVLNGGAALSVLRREEALERQILDGRLTATMPVEGLRVGDILHMTFSTTSKDPTLKGHAQAVAPLMFDPFRVEFARVRMIWPKGDDVRWKAFADGVTAQPAVSGAYKELVVALPLPKQAEMPDDAPVRFQKLPMMEATSFPDWASVAAVMAPLYRTEGLIAAGSPLEAEVARIEKAAGADPAKRAALALQLVQEEVRYQLMAMANGNYVPQKPAETWSIRYGDCKAKTLLLLALLHELGIEAEPVLVHSQLGDLVPARLPSVGAFDHVLVRASIGGESLWLDGTATGARLADLRDTPPFRHALPVRDKGAELMAIPARPNARPDMAGVVEIDNSAGLNLPALFQGTVTVRGQMADMLKAAVAQGSPEDIEMAAEQAIAGLGLNEPALVSHKVTFDAAEAVAKVEASGLAYPAWKRENERLGLDLGERAAVPFAPDRARPAWRDIPFVGGHPSHFSLRQRLRLPAGGEGFALDGEEALEQQVGSTRVEQKAALAEGWLAIEARLATSGAEVPASDIAEARKRAAQVQARLLRALAPKTAPGRWQEVETARRENRLAPILAAFDARVAAEPKEAQPYLERAWYHDRVFDRRKAVDDLNRALAIEPKAETLLERAELHYILGDVAKAAADAEEALRIDPSSEDALASLAQLKAEAGDSKAAIALLQERIDAGGKDAGKFLSQRAEIEARQGAKEVALATIDQAIERQPGDPGLLNSRCWIKGTLNVALDTALKDCTKSIELSQSPAQALDSRAMVYFRMNRFEDALTDLEAALGSAPEMAASLYLRGIIKKRSGDPTAAADLAAARLLAPPIDKEYARYGVKP